MNSLFHNPHRPGYFFMAHPPSGFSKSSGFSSKAGKADAICEGKNLLQETYQCEAPQDISWFISPSNYSYKYHKP
jgi:hypothetical protein